MGSRRFAILLQVLLAACGGGAPDLSRSPPETGLDPLLLEIPADFEIGAEGLNLSGTSVTAGADAAETRLVPTYGRLDASGRTLIADARHAFYAPGFAEGASVTRSGPVTYHRRDLGGLALIAYTGTFPGEDGPAEVLSGVTGIPSAGLPRSGRATWRGSAWARWEDGATAFDLAGSATVAADFSAGTVDVILDGLAAADGAEPADRIAISGLAIAGAGYEGATIDAPLGGPVRGAAAGGFFGSREGLPAETGGSFLASGSTVSVAGGWGAALAPR